MFVCLLLKIMLLFLTRKYSLKDNIKTDTVAAAKLDTGSLVQVFYLYLFLRTRKGDFVVAGFHFSQLLENSP